jgi:membrane dipeptidase
MKGQPMIPVFDGHNDLLLKLHGTPDRAALWRLGTDAGQLDLPRMTQGGFAGGLFAIFVPPTEEVDWAAMDALMDAPPYDLPLPRLMTHGEAQPAALAMAGYLMAMERQTPEHFALCRSTSDIRAAMASGRIAAVMHMEGAEAIDPDLEALHVFHTMGLRSLGPVWSRPTIFAHGVPFRFPGSPDTGPGLTEAGERLVRECDALRIVIDLSHLNAKGVDDVARLSDAPLIATHSNAHAVTPSTRNLTDRQLAMIRERGGMVGLNFATVFLREDGRRATDCGWEPVLRHLDHLIAHLGEDHVGFGSDFDGAAVPDVIGDAAGLPRLIEALRAHGYDDALLHKLAHQNWIAALERVWDR